MRCEGCGARAAVCLKANNLLLHSIRFCHVCGASFPLNSNKREVSLRINNNNNNNNNINEKKTILKSISREEAIESLRKRLIKKSSHAIIYCVPYSDSNNNNNNNAIMRENVAESSSISSSLTSSLYNYDNNNNDSFVNSFIFHNENNINNNNNFKNNIKGPPIFYAWPIEFLKDKKEEFKDILHYPSVFIQSDEVYQVISELVLEFNTFISSLQMNSLNEKNKLQQYIREIKNELQEKRIKEIEFINRISQLEREMHEQNAKFTQELLEERNKSKKEREFYRKLEEDQQDNMNMAYNMLRETLLTDHMTN